MFLSAYSITVWFIQLMPFNIFGEHKNICKNKTHKQPLLILKYLIFVFKYSRWNIFRMKFNINFALEHSLEHLISQLALRKLTGNTPYFQ